MPSLKNRVATALPTLPKGILEADEFGKHLVLSQDLDPVYVILWKAKLSPDELKQFLFAYWCFYHCGTSSWIVDGPGIGYWTRMLQAAETSVRPRGTERRHFRGLKAIKAVQWFAEVGIDGLFSQLQFTRTPDLADVMKVVQRWPQFGPWIAFKVADMLDRLGLLRINFSAADTFLFDSPRKGAALLVARYANGEQVGKGEEPEWAFRYLEARIGSLMAPPRLERTLNGQEYETILCKVKAHWEGRYPVGHDIIEIREGLDRFPGYSLAQRLKKELP